MNFRKQQGMSIVGFIMVLSLAIFASFIGMRLAPIYLEYYSVVNAMNGVAEERGSAQFSTRQARIKMFNRLYANYADDNVKEENVNVVRKNGSQLHVKYSVRKPLIGNLDVIAEFDRMVRLSN